MEKKVRKAVRSYLIRDNKVVVIKYNQGNIGFYDIPGGKIEENESSEEASVREFMEETGISIIKQHHIGHIFIDYPERIFNLEVFLVDEYSGTPKNFEENDSMWVDIESLEKEERLLPSTRIISYVKNGMNIKIECDSNHNILSIK